MAENLNTPWTARRDDSGGESGLWSVVDAGGAVVFFGLSEEIARLFAAAPDQKAEIERLQTALGYHVNELQEARRQAIRDRNTLMWTFDRLSICGSGNGDRLTQREQIRTMQEIGKVLAGRPSPAARYQPEATDKSSQIIMQAAAAPKQPRAT